jgi:hypothetical protein
METLTVSFIVQLRQRKRQRSCNLPHPHWQKDYLLAL